MKLNSKLTLTILTIFLAAVLVVGFLVFSNSKANLEGEIKNKLQSVSEITENNINTFIQGQENKIELIATQSALSAEELQQMLVLDDSFYDLFVIDANGTVVTSSNPARVGLDRSTRDYFVKARNNTYISPVYFALVPQEYSIAVSTPFHGGVLVGSMKLDILNRLISNRVGLGETGETLLAFLDEKGNTVYFTDRRFSNQSLETLTPAQMVGRAMDYALNEDEEILVNVKDYRNVNTISVTNYIEIIRIGMVTKMDVAEAFSKIQNLQRITVYITLAIFLLIALVIYFISRTISKEIVDLTEDINKITRGDLEIQLKKSGTTEIQSLIDSLNRILASMKLAILRTGLSKSEMGVGEAVKAKEEAEERYKILYESSADAIMTIEPPSWKFTAGNPSAIKMFAAKDEKDFTSRSPWEFSPRRQPNKKMSGKEAKKMIEKALKEGSVLFNWTHKRLNGEEFPASVLLTRVKTKDKEYIQATVRDLTEKKDNKENK